MTKRFDFDEMCFTMLDNARDSGDEPQYDEIVKLLGTQHTGIMGMAEDIWGFDDETDVLVKQIEDESKARSIERFRALKPHQRFDYSRYFNMMYKHEFVEVSKD